MTTHGIFTDGVPETFSGRVPDSGSGRKSLQYKPGDKLLKFERGNWVPCIIIKIASYVGKSGPGYYAAYDPPRESCSEFWTCDRFLKSAS